MNSRQETKIMLAFEDLVRSHTRQVARLGERRAGMVLVINNLTPFHNFLESGGLYGVLPNGLMEKTFELVKAAHKHKVDVDVFEQKGRYLAMDVSQTRYDETVCEAARLLIDYWAEQNSVDADIEKSKQVIDLPTESEFDDLLKTTEL